MSVIEWVMDTIESVFGFVVDAMGIAIKLLVIIAFFAAVGFGLFKAYEKLTTTPIEETRKECGK